MIRFGDRIRARLVDRAMGNARFDPYRARIAAAAAGKVLEIGIGSGLNLPYYGGRVTSLAGIDPSPGLLSRTLERSRGFSFPVRLVEGSAERLPFEDRSFDMVSMTWTGCSISDIQAAYGEIRRVLRPGGRLLFVEHGRDPAPAIARCQDLLTPLWRRISGGCRLNRPFDSLLTESGFRVERLDTGYMTGLRRLAFIYEGSAVPR